MLSPKHQHYADRLRTLVQEGEELLEHTHLSTGVLRRILSGHSYYLILSRQQQYRAWLTSALNIINLVLGEDSIHAEQMRQHIEGGSVRDVITGVTGVLEAGLNDLEGGFLLSQEFLLAGDVLDSVLQQAIHLNSTGYKDPAAVLARVALEDALRRIAREEGLDDSGTAAQINTALWKAGRYAKPQWRLISACLDIGNAAAHGNFDEFTREDVAGRIDDIERFLANELHP